MSYSVRLPGQHDFYTFSMPCSRDRMSFVCSAGSICQACLQSYKHSEDFIVDLDHMKNQMCTEVSYNLEVMHNNTMIVYVILDWVTFLDLEWFCKYVSNAKCLGFIKNKEN